MATIAVLGAGNFGTALAQVAASNGHAVRVWSIEPDVLAEIQDRHTNSKYLAGVRLHERIEAVAGIEKALEAAEMVIIAVPSRAVAAVARDAAPRLSPGQTVLNVAKGLEAGTRRRMSQVLADELGPAFVGEISSMGGPAIAAEMVMGQPTALIVAAGEEAAAVLAQRLLQNEYVKVETSGDVAGVEICAALKNVYAIALGVCDSLVYGTNTKAFLLGLALEEMAQICAALGGREDTVYGLAGLGDLLTTGLSELSRNRSFGEQMGSGADWQGYLKAHTVEGVAACRELEPAVAALGLRTPLLGMVHRALAGESPAAEAMRSFFREFRYE